MFEFVKRWQECRRRKSILRDIKKAKQLYLTGKERFMCLCFKAVNYYIYIPPPKIYKKEYLSSIPGFVKLPLTAPHGGHTRTENRESKRSIN